MHQYTIYCTPEQTKKAIELGAPIDWHCDDFSDYCISVDYIEKGLWAIIPTAEQMIGWLEKQGDLIIIYHEIDWLFSINHFEGEGRFNTRKEATLAAIDAALDYLIKMKE